jgi:hypothetical protein
MPNPDIIAQSLYEQLATARFQYNNLGLSKASREQALANVRRLEAELDLPEAERTPNHNGPPAEVDVLTIDQLQGAKDRLRTGVLPYMDVGLIIRALQAGNEDQRALAEALLRK